MKLLDAILRPFGYRKARPRKRAYAIAQLNRLTQDWITTSTTMDADLRNGLAPVRARARDLSQNDAYARRYLSLVRMNVPGPNGFTLQVKAFDINRQRDEATGKTLTTKVWDEYANTQIENEFYRWSRKEFCTVTGTMTFRDVQHLVIETVARDGEILVRKIRDRQNPYGFTLQIIEPDLLDDQHNQILPNGRVVRLGVEFDEWRRPIAYHLKRYDVRTEYLSDTYDTTGNTIRIPAGEMYHLFRPERAFQSRGVSWMAPAMFALKMLTGYEEAALVNARASAAQMGFLKDRENSAGPVPHDEVDGEGNKIQNTEPGLVIDIGDKDFVAYDPKYPDAQHEMFVKAILRRFASGTGASYNLLANDLEGVNYSSIRAGLLDEREQWKDIQTWMIEAFLEPLFADWLEMFLLSERTTLPFSKFDKFNAPMWIGRRWPWVDPSKDIEAHERTVRAGFKSARRIMAEEGSDLPETYAEIAEDRMIAEGYGLSLSIHGPGGEEPPRPEDDEDDEDEDTKRLLKKRNGHNHQG